MISNSYGIKEMATPDIPQDPNKGWMVDAAKGFVDKIKNSRYAAGARAGAAGLQEMVSGIGASGRNEMQGQANLIDVGKTNVLGQTESGKLDLEERKWFTPFDEGGGKNPKPKPTEPWHLLESNPKPEDAWKVIKGNAPTGAVIDNFGIIKNPVLDPNKSRSLTR